MSNQVIVTVIISLLVAAPVGFIGGWYASNQNPAQQLTVETDGADEFVDGPEIAPAAEGEGPEFIDINDEDVLALVGEEMYQEYLAAAELLNNELEPQAFVFIEAGEEIPDELMSQLEEQQSIIDEVMQLYYNSRL